MGVTIIAVLAFIAGIFGLLASITLIGLSGVAASVGYGPFPFLGGLVLLAISVAELAIGYGFWTTKPWAWRLGVILQFAQVAWAVLSLVLVRFDLGNLIVTVIIAAVLIYYLNKPAIRAVFGAPASGLPIVGNALDPYLNRIKI
jgi:hypothetical protein